MGRPAALCTCKHTKASHSHRRTPVDGRYECKAIGCACAEYVPARVSDKALDAEARMREALAEAEARGFERAREMAAKEAQAAVMAWLGGTGDVPRQCGEYVAQRIRATKDENGAGRPTEVAATSRGQEATSEGPRCSFYVSYTHGEECDECGLPIGSHP